MWCIAVQMQSCKVASWPVEQARSLTWSPFRVKCSGSCWLFAAPSSVWTSCLAASDSGVPSSCASVPAPLIMLYIMIEPSFSPSAFDAVDGSMLMPTWQSIKCVELHVR